MADKKLIVLVSACNVKKIDCKAYGVGKQLCQVRVKVDDKEVWTTMQPGLDPTWEETFEFDITDEANTKVTATFYMDEKDKQKQIGDEQQYLLPVLTKGQPVFKGLIVPGGQINMMFTAIGFGKEGVEEDPSAFMDMMDDGEMCMDDDE